MIISAKCDEVVLLNVPLFLAPAFSVFFHSKWAFTNQFNNIRWPIGISHNLCSLYCINLFLGSLVAFRCRMCCWFGFKCATTLETGQKLFRKHTHSHSEEKPLCRSHARTHTETHTGTNSPQFYGCENLSENDTYDIDKASVGDLQTNHCLWWLRFFTHSPSSIFKHNKHGKNKANALNSLVSARSPCTHSETNASIRFRFGTQRKRERES